jgi:hypothetical protein
VCVLSSGHLLYFGEATQAVDWFASSLGYTSKYAQKCKNAQIDDGVYK